MHTAQTLMFVNISPVEYNADETHSALVYAARVKLITNSAEKQQETQQIRRLKAIIAELRRGGTVSAGDAEAAAAEAEAEDAFGDGAEVSAASGCGGGGGGGGETEESEMAAALQYEEAALLVGTADTL